MFKRTSFQHGTSVVRSAHDRLVDMVIASPALISSKTGLIGPILAPERSEIPLSC